MYGGTWPPQRCELLTRTDKTISLDGAAALIDALRCPPQPREPLGEMDWRCQAADALGKIGNEAAVPALTEALGDGACAVREAATEALDKLRISSAATMAGFIEALKSAHPSARRNAAEVLGELGPDAKTAVPSLVNSLDDEDNGVRWATTIALGEIGPDAKVAVPALIKALGDKALEVRMRAAQALGKIGDEAAAPALTKALKDHELVAIHAHYALAKITSKPQEHVPSLIEALKGKAEDWTVRSNAAEALGEIGPDAKAAVPALTEALGDDPPVLVYVHYALAKITGRKEDHMRALTRIAKDDVWGLSNKAAKVLEKVGKNA